MLTTLIPYIPFVFPFFPAQVLGFNLTGWAWMIMLLVTLLNLVRTKSVEFPILFWLPWILYMTIYLVIDFSVLGLQLSLQYALPIFIGVVASGFSYEGENLNWLFRSLLRLCIIIYAMFLFGYFFKGGYGPSAASTSMFFSVIVSVLSGMFFTTRDKRFLFYVGLLLLASILQTTRMGIAVTTVVFIIHFANRSFIGKILYGGIGVLTFILIFNSKPFQEKTFYGGQGSISDVTVNYYDNPDIRSSGRISWKKALEPGLKAAPVWGNGPRADNVYLTKITKMRGGEAHNDYLSVRFNYGYIGLFLLLFGFAVTFIELYRISMKYYKNFPIRLLSTSTLTLFFAFLMFMYTDNILKYTVYFPNYFFAMIGIVYSMKKDEYLVSNPSL